MLLSDGESIRIYPVAVKGYGYYGIFSFNNYSIFSFVFYYGVAF